MKYLFSLLLILSIISCKKKKVDVEEKSALELLAGTSSKTWKLKEGKAKQGEISVSLLDSQNPCVTDNQITLFTDFTYEFKEGATKCSPSDPDLILKAQWKLDEVNESMTIDRFKFLDFTIEKPEFKLSDVKENTFSGSTTVTVSTQTVQLDVTFERVN